MNAHFVMREMPDMRQQGTQVVYPKMMIRRQVDTDEIIERISHSCTLTASDLKAAISAIGLEIARSVADGCSVKIDGIGTFHARLGIKETAERETLDEEKTRRNGQSVAVTGIHLRTDRNLIRSTNTICRLKRSGNAERITRSKYNLEKRIARSLAFLDSHPILTVHDYMKLTGLKRTMAGKELRQLSLDPATGIAATGRASHRIYVKAK